MGPLAGIPGTGKLIARCQELPGLVILLPWLQHLPPHSGDSRYGHKHVDVGCSCSPTVPLTLVANIGGHGLMGHPFCTRLLPYNQQRSHPTQTERSLSRQFDVQGAEPTMWPKLRHRVQPNTR